MLAPMLFFDGRMGPQVAAEGVRLAAHLGDALTFGHVGRAAKS
jgi:hypothetical protein